MITERRVRPVSLGQALLIILSVSAWWLGTLATRGRLSWETFVIVVAGGIVLNLWVRGRLWLLFCLGVASVVFGHRSVYVGYWTYFIPLQVIIWALWVYILLEQISHYHVRYVRIPSTLMFLTVWAVVRAVVTWAMGGKWDPILAWTSPVILGMPTFSVVRYLVKDISRVATVLNIFLVITSVMSLLALIERFVPQAHQVFPGLFRRPYILTSQGFIRSHFSFWGYPAASVVVVWGLLVAYGQLIEGRRKAVYMGIITLDMMAIYFSGTRAAWIGMVGGLVILFLANVFDVVLHSRPSQRRASPFARSWILPSAVLLMLAISTMWLPESFGRRWDTVIEFAQGSVPDTSLASRVARWTWARKAILSAPFAGVGYGHWLAHNSFLEIGSTLGVLPAIAFAIFVLQLLRRIMWTAFLAPSEKVRYYGRIFLAMASVWSVQLSVQPALQVPPFTAPLWVLMALSWYMKDMEDNKHATDYGSYSYL